MKLLTLITAATLVLLPATLAEDAGAIYERECSKCHGADGKGDTKMGKKLGAKDYTDPKVQEKMKDEEMVKAIRSGLKDGDKTLMKPFDKLAHEDIKALVAHMRAFGKK